MFDQLNGAYDFLTAVLLPLFMCFRSAVQAVLNVVFGPRKHQISANSATCYQILANLKMHFAWPNGTDKFLLKFKKMEDISVIEQENVFLSQVNASEFHFIRTRPDVNILDMQKHPLFIFSLYDHAEEVIVVPYETLFRYLKGCPDTDGRNITLLHNIGRCGSTLVASMVFQTGQCQVLSEPLALAQAIVLTNQLYGPNFMDDKSNLAVLRATLRILCRDPDVRYFIKITGIFTGNSVQMIHQVLPETKDLFLYRDLVPTLQSFYRILGRFYFWTTSLDCSLENLPCKYKRIWEKVKVSGIHERILFILLCQMHPFYLESEKRQNMMSYSYESLLEDKAAFCTSLLEEIGIEKQYVPLALDALNKDSQDNTPISRKRGAASVKCTVSREALDWARRIGMEEFGIEIEGKNGRISNAPLSWDRNWRGER
ncbi:hypothetical protein ACHWQZ_G015058 [Mnemiopsis leidyi]